MEGYSTKYEAGVGCIIEISIHRSHILILNRKIQVSNIHSKYKRKKE